MKKIILAIIMNVLFVSVFDLCGMQATTHGHLGETFAGRQNIRVITIKRNSGVYGYGKLDQGEINLIFAQLADCISGPKVSFELLSNRTGSSKIKEGILQIYTENVGKLPTTSHNMTVILFNEMFFGKDSALTKTEVDYIIDSYKAFHKFLPNTFLHINFLYKDICSEHYKSQLQESGMVYKEICGNVYPFSFMNFIDDYERKTENDSFCKSYMEKILASGMAPTLLFNQTKVFFEGYEIGFYNKSSHYLESLADFMDETEKTLKTECPFYVIGNFCSHYSEFLTLSKSWEHETACKMWMDSITNLVCYDIDAIENEVPYKRKTKNPVLFASNSHYCLMASITSNPLIYTGVEEVGTKTFICADPEGTELDRTIIKNDELITTEDARTGIFKINSKTIFPIEPIKALSSLDFRFGPNLYNIQVYDLNLFK